MGNMGLGQWRASREGEETVVEGKKKVSSVIKQVVG